MATEKLGLTPAEFAKASNVPLHRVRRWIADGRIAADKQGKYSKCLIPRSELGRLKGEVLPMVDLGPALPQLEELIARAVAREFAKVFRTGGER